MNFVLENVTKLNESLCSSILVVPVILGGEKGSAVVALDLESLDTVWKYQGWFSVSYYAVGIEYMRIYRLFGHIFLVIISDILCTIS